MTSPLAESVAEEVRVVLARRRMSIARLAAALDVSHAYLSRRLSGEVALDVTDLERIASVLGVTVASLMPKEEAA